MLYVEFQTLLELDEINYSNIYSIQSLPNPYSCRFYPSICKPELWQRTIAGVKEYIILNANYYPKNYNSEFNYYIVEHSFVSGEWQSRSVIKFETKGE